jgi:predicted deacylase
LAALVHEAPAAGPRLVLTAGVHGDEWVGPTALLKLDGWLGQALLAGSVTLYPTVNLSGLRASLREVEEDGADLNRAFPGTSATVSGRLAEALFTDLVRRQPEVLIDLHSDAVWSVPYALVDRAVCLPPDRRGGLERRMQELAAVSGLLTLRDYPDLDYRRSRLDRSLTGAAVNRLEIPALTLEIGPRRGHHPPSVVLAVAVVKRLLAHLGMVAPSAHGEEASFPPQPGVWRRGVGGRVRRGGLLEPLLPPGSVFQPGVLLARVWGPDGSLADEVRSDGSGLLVAWLDRAWVEAGQAVCTVGLAEG